MLGLLTSMLMLIMFQDAHAESKPVATAIHIFGNVTVISSAQASKQNSRKLTLNSPLYKGDTISTTANSFTVIQFVDEAKMTLRPNTQFRIDDYEYSAEKNQASMELIKGGLRILTGLIGKKNPQAYKINTSHTTIGIRGTVFDARLCGQDCVEDSRSLGVSSDIPTGLYVPVYEHAVALTRGDLKLPVTKGNTGYATPTVLELLKFVPRFLSEDKYPRPDQFKPEAASAPGNSDLALDNDLEVLEEPAAAMQKAPDGRLNQPDANAQGDFRPAVTEPAVPVVAAPAAPITASTSTPKPASPPKKAPTVKLPSDKGKTPPPPAPPKGGGGYVKPLLLDYKAPILLAPPAPPPPPAPSPIL
jgi:hypothetical protein